MVAAGLGADDRAGIALFGEVLRRAGYTADGLRAALQAEGDALTPNARQIPLLLRILPPRKALTELISLFLFGLPLERDRASAALGPLPLERALGLGVLAPEGERVSATLRLLPYADALIASDKAFESTPGLRADHVMAVTRSSMFLADLVPPNQVARALDLGTGSGIQAILLSRHAGRVVATDVNPRALEYASFNACLNGATNIELRRGSFFEPVENESFDLIVSNPPFVISPENALVFRDAGLRGDAVSREVVRGAAARLRDGGIAVTLISWVIGTDETWSAGPRRWLEGLDRDAWLLHASTDTPLTHAESWLHPLFGVDPSVHDAAIDRWIAYYEELGADAIGYGAAVLRRRDGGRRWLRADDLDGERPVGGGEQILRLIEAQDVLSMLADERAVLDLVVEREPRHRLEQVLRCADGVYGIERATLRVERGIPFATPVDAFGAQLFAYLDGTRTVREAAALAVEGLPRVEDADDRAAATVRSWLARGLLRPR